MSSSVSKLSELATLCSSYSPSQTVIRQHFPTRTSSCSTVHKPSRSVTGSTTASGTPGADRRPYRLTNRIERWPTIRKGGELVYADNFNVRLLHHLPVATS
jgi:hypothetical protein